MPSLGHFHTLPVVRLAPPGAYVDAGPLGEILVPKRYVAPTVKPGERLDLFIYRDSEDRLVATPEKPFAVVGECACLRVASVKAGVGAFLSWGLEKDLLLPLREQTRTVRPLDWVVVVVAIDAKSDRIMASARLDRWLDQSPPPFKAGQQVSLLIEAETPLGYRAIIEHTHRGLLYHSDLPGPLTIGKALTGFIRTIREDGKIDLSLQAAGYKRIASVTDQIVQRLNESGGRLALHDGSSPDEIRRVLGISKKAFKQVIGSLYRERRIVIEENGIRLNSR